MRAWAVGDQVVADYPNSASAPAWGASESAVQAALAEADLVFQHTFHTPIQHQAYLEPHACMVSIDERDVAHIAREVLDKLPDEHAIRAIDISRGR